jgi:hypothetical protein
MVSLQTINAIAARNGTSFSEMLKNAEDAGLLDKQSAAALRTKATEDLAGAQADLEKEIAVANARFNVKKSKIDEIVLKAEQTDASADETLTAVEAAKIAMGKTKTE